MLVGFPAVIYRLVFMPALRSCERLIDTNPLLRVLLPLMSGIGVAEWSYPLLSGWELFLYVAAAFAGVVCFLVVRGDSDSSYRSMVFQIALFFGLMALGAASLIDRRSALEVEWPGEARVFQAMAVETPRETDKTVQVTARLDGGAFSGQKIRLVLMKPKGGNVSSHKDGEDKNAATGTYVRKTSAREPATEKNKVEVNGGVTVGMDGKRLPRVGDRLLFFARVETPRNAGNPGEFDYATWLRHRGIAGTAFCYASEWALCENGSDHLPFGVCALRVRERLVGDYARYFGGSDLGVLSAMTLGDKSRLDAGTREVFSRTGTSHILALSGLHLGILFAVYHLFVLSFCHRRRVYVAMSILGIAGLWLFAFLAGLPISLVRAALMFSVMQLSVCLRRDSFSVNNLALAALLLLLVSPQSLFDVGFQLSCVAVLFILLLPFSPGTGLWYRLRGLLLVSFAAQIGTLPLVAHYFHIVPVYGLLVQPLAIPLTYLVLVVSVLFLCIPFLRVIWVPVLAWLMDVMQSVLGFFADLPGAVLVWRPSVPMVVAYYIVVALLIAYLLRRRSWPLYAIAGVIVFMTGMEFYSYGQRNLSPRVIFYNLRTVAAVHAIPSVGNSYLWSAPRERADSALASVRRTYWEVEGISSPVCLSGEVDAPGLRFSDDVLCLGRLRVALPADSLPPAFPARPFAVNYLLLHKGVKARLDVLLRHFRPDTVVLDAGLSDRRRRKYAAAARSCGVTVYDMREQGALVVKVE